MNALRAYNHSDQYARAVRDWATDTRPGSLADGHHSGFGTAGSRRVDSCD